MTPKTSRLHCGTKVGRWSLVARVDSPDQIKWHCVCECGTSRVVRQDHLISGQSRSCGCYRAEQHSRAIGVALIPTSRDFSHGKRV